MGAHASWGCTVHLVLELETAERTIPVPPELDAALASHALAAAALANLSYSHRKDYAHWVAGAKKPGTREARATKAITRLVEGKPGR